MKKCLLFLSLALAFVFTSCQKDYYCICENTNTGKVSKSDPIKASVFTKKAAEKSCEADGDLSGGVLKCHLE